MAKFSPDVRAIAAALLVVEILSTYEWRGVVVEAGDRTDGNTVPRLLQWLIPRHGWAALAGYGHDKLPRGKEADLWWREAIIELASEYDVRFGKQRAYIGWAVLAANRRTGLRPILVKAFRPPVDR